MITATIYKITHPATPADVYIGQTIRNPSVRMRQHRHAAAQSNLLLYRWWRARVEEFGEAPIMEVLRSFEAASVEEAKAWADAAETAEITTLRDSSNRCLNLTSGGAAPVFSPEARARMSASARQRSPETQARMNEAQRRPRSAAARANMSAAQQRIAAARKAA